ncbi:MAG TPA: OmpA family protein [Desulfohalobiaceae bacterium]|nr:OmpA family protein [Desulfohalobiaceae bacterium]
MIKKKNYLLVAFIFALVLSIMACSGASRQQKGTGYGAAAGAGLGALIGQAIGGDTESTLWGAGAGAIVGAIAGNQVGKYMDNQERDLRSALAQERQASIQRERDILQATFKSGVFFDFDSATLKPGGRRELERVAQVLNKYPKTTIRVEGHTDKAGSETYNQELSERRAEAVKNALIQMGVIKERIQAIGYGESQPVSSDPAENRRVAIFIKPITKG